MRQRHGYRRLGALLRAERQGSRARSQRASRSGPATGTKLVAVVVACGVLLATAASSWGAARPFSQRFSTNDTGNIAMVANTLVTCPAVAANCAAARAGTASPLTENNNNAFTMQYVNTDPAPGIFNSSSATLTLPPGATVLRAMLYFGGDSTAGAGGGAAPPDASQRNHVQFKVPGGTYQDLTAIAPLDNITTSGDDFQGIVDVTSLVGAAGSGPYSVGNVQAGTGQDRQAGWSLIVAYRSTSEPPRNLTIFDGFRVVNTGSPNLTIPVSGFQTPPSGPVRTQLGFVAYEGDRGSTGDSVQLNTTTLSDASHPANNFFNSSIAIDGSPFTAKDPDYVNQLGFDSSLARADNILANGDTSATIRLTTGGETYYPGAVTFATELFAPSVALTKSVDDLNGGAVQPGDTLRYTVTATNSGGDDATNVVITDPIPSNTTFVPGSLVPAATSSFNASANRAVFRVGTGATATQGGTLAGGGGTATVSFDVTVGTAPSGTQIVNDAHADFFAATLGTPLSADSNTVTETLAAPDLTVAKLPATFTAINGATQAFTLRVTNGGDAPTSGMVTVTDAFEGVPSGAFDSIDSIVAPGWSCTPATPAATPATLSCERSDPLAAGASYDDIVVTAHVGALPNNNILNTATVAGGGDGDPSNNSGTSTGQTTTRADVQILKTADRTTAMVGQQVTFTLRVRNAGPSAAADVEVQDPGLAGNYTVDSVSSSVGGCSALPCTLGSLATGGEETVTVVATVVAGPGAAGNTASVTTTTEDPDTTNNSSTAAVDVVPTADLSITKSLSPDPLQAGQAASYTLTVHNDGPQAATSTLATDPLPAGFVFGSASPGCDYDAPSNTVRCDLGSVAANTDAIVTIDGTIAMATAGNVVSNSASVTSDTSDPDLTNNTATAAGVAGAAADLRLTKSADDPTPRPGDTVAFTLVATNLGPSEAADVEVTDTLPDGLTLISAPGCTPSGSTLTCAVGTLASGASRSFQITARVGASLAGTSVTNVATVSSTTPDPVPSNGTGTAVLDVARATTPGGPATTPEPPTTSLPAPGPVPGAPSSGESADLGLTKRTLDEAHVGQRLRYELGVRNEGPGAASDVAVTDTLPDDVEFVSAAATRGTCAGERTIRCAIGELGSGDQATVTVTVIPRAPGRVSNAATVASSTPDPRAANNAARVASTVEWAPTRVSVRKTVDRETVRAGATVTYRIRVRTVGRAAAHDLRVCDRPPSGLSFVQTHGGRLRSGQACWTIGELAPGSGRTLRATMRVAALASQRTLTNRVRVSGANVEPTAARERLRVLPSAARAGGVTG